MSKDKLNYQKWFLHNSRQCGKTQMQKDILEFKKRQEDFRQEYLGGWVEPSKEVLELAERHIYECEKFDRSVCTGRMGKDGVLPANPEERFLITKNARERFEEVKNYCLKNRISWKSFLACRRIAERCSFEYLERKYGE